jgi:16S rRNA (guanine527-N7)-methyltransferase
MTLAARLVTGLGELGADLPQTAQQKLLDYLQVMAKWNRVYNLTALKSPGEWVTHHVLDSLAVLPYVEGPTVVDVGSGAGLPGLVLAIARPDWHAVSVETVDKKAAFQRQVVVELGLTNVEIEACRVEELVMAEKADTVVSRAFSSLADFVRLTRHLLKPTGQWVAMKGKAPHEEIAALPGDVTVRQLVELSVPGLHAKRCVVRISPCEKPGGA